jgi:hypothetical protein
VTANFGVLVEALTQQHIIDRHAERPALHPCLQGARWSRSRRSRSAREAGRPAALRLIAISRCQSPLGRRLTVPRGAAIGICPRRLIGSESWSMGDVIPRRRWQGTSAGWWGCHWRSARAGSTRGGFACSVQA